MTTKLRVVRTTKAATGAIAQQLQIGPRRRWSSTYSRDAESSQRVTGPSLVRAMCM